MEDKKFNWKDPKTIIIACSLVLNLALGGGLYHYYNQTVETQSQLSATESVQAEMQADYDELQEQNDELQAQVDEIQPTIGDNPKFCVTAKSGANREKFIMGGRRVKRLPPC